MNNAAYRLFGAVEELTEPELRSQLETNLFGAVWVVQAALPHLREQGSGRIIQISSTGGLTASPLGGGYIASKWALEGLSESLAQEIAGFGIKVTLVEPSSYATGMIARAAQTNANPPLRRPPRGLCRVREDDRPRRPRRCGQGSPHDRRQRQPTPPSVLRHSRQPDCSPGLRRPARDLGRLAAPCSGSSRNNRRR